jgi:hypothetical protein
MGQGGNAIEVEVRGQPADLAERLAKLPAVSKAHGRTTSEGTTVFEIAASADVRAEVARLLVSTGCDLLRLTRSESRLESIFMNLTQAGGPQ